MCCKTAVGRAVACPDCGNGYAAGIIFSYRFQKKGPGI